MRNVLDWTCASTSLYLFMWLRVEQIFSTFVDHSCNLVVLYSRARYHHVGFRWGHDQSSLFNILFGAACIAIAVLAVVLPLYLFSSLNPSQENNPVVSFDATLSIVVSNISAGSLFVATKQIGVWEYLCLRASFLYCTHLLLNMNRRTQWKRARHLSSVEVKSVPQEPELFRLNVVIIACQLDRPRNRVVPACAGIPRPLSASRACRLLSRCLVRVAAVANKPLATA